jgi:outer membrane protein OmpA-like peptidoglycan-associated protein
MILAAIGLIVGASAPAFAQINDDPTTSGTTGLFAIPRAGTVEQGRWQIGAYYQEIAREEADTRIQTLGFSGAYGLTDRMEIFLGFEPSVKIDRRFTAEANPYAMVIHGAGGPFPFPIPDPISGLGINEHPFATGADSSGMGDIWVGGKLKFVGDPYDYEGMAAMAAVKLPTSKTSDGIGTGSFSVEGRLIGSVEAWEKVGWNAYVGYVYHDTPDLDSKLNGIPSLTSQAGQTLITLPTQWRFFVAPEFLYGVGVQLPTRATIQFIGEWQGRVTNKDMNQAYTGGTDQSMVSAGIRATFDSGLAINAMGHYQTDIKVRDADWQVDANAVDDAIRRWGFGAGVSYSTSRRTPLVYAGTAPLAVPLLNSAPTLSCRAERTSLRQGESVRLVATTSDPDGDPVEVMWDAAAGSLSSRTGDTVTWNSTGVPAGSGRIVARANDGYGGTADCEVSVSVTAPPEPGEPTILEFMCAEFTSGGSRIDNRCKAVLDDVALQMRNNPGATAVIVGHSDSTSNSDTNNPLSMERADNARTYLMDTHGIDASRIAVESQGAAQPMADNGTSEGRAQNRRIEIVVTIPPR